MAHSSLELSSGGKNDKYKAITERLNFFERGLFEDVNAEGDRFGQFLGQNQESFLKNIFEIYPPAYFRMDVLKTLDFVKSDFQFCRTFLVSWHDLMFIIIASDFTDL